MDSLCVTYNSDNIFSSKGVRQSFNVFYSANIANSSDIWFCSNMVGCHYCIDCDSLENKSYCIENKQLSKEDFLEKKKELLHNKSSFSAKKFTTFSRMGNGNSPQSTGASIINSNHIENGYFVAYGRDSRNVLLFEGGNTGSYQIYDGIDI